MRSLGILIGLLTLLAHPLGAARRMTADDLFALQDIAEIRASPDGAIVLFTATTTDLNANRTTTRLMRISGAGAEPAAVPDAPEDAHNLRWSKDGSRLAFLAGKASQAAVWVLDAASGKLTRVCGYDRGNSFLSQAGNALAWSADGARLAFAGTTEPPPGVQDPLIITRLQYKTRTSYSDNRRSHIYVVASRGGSPSPLTSGDHDEHSIDWVGEEIVFLSNREPDPDANLNYDIFAINAASLGIRQITKTPGVEMDPHVSPDGRSIAYVATRRNLTTIDSVAEDAHIWVVPTSGGQGRELNSALDRRSSSPQWSADGKSVFYTASDRGKTLIYRVDGAGGASTPLFDRRAQAGPFSVAADGSVIFGLSDPATPREVFRWTKGRLQQITKLNSGIVAQWQLVEPKTISFHSFDGQAVEGWLYPSIEPAASAPLILSIHGGPHGMYGYAFNPGFQFNAVRGYATLAINPRGSSGYGQKVSDGCVNDWGGGDYKDLMAGVDYALRENPNLDSKRMGVTGSSYGGFMTNWVITQTTRFKAAVAKASLSNLISFYSTSLYQDLVHAEFGGYPWDRDNFQALWKWSPLAHVKNVTTPTLLIHGEQDNDVHITQAEEMYTALRQRGIPAVLVRYPREGHGFTEPKHQFDSAVRTIEWMDRFCNRTDKR